MPEIKFVTNVAELGLFRSVAKTRGRLLLSTVVCTAATIGIGLASAAYVLEQSTSVGLNLGLITLTMFLVLVVAYLQSVVVGDFAFTGPWREQVILGVTPEQGASVQNHNAEFMIVLLIAFLANGMIVNFGAGGFLDTYHTEGFFRSQLRSPDADDRQEALTYLADPMNFELWPMPAIQKLVMQHLDDPDEQTRLTAIWNAGEMEIVSARDELRQIVVDTDAAPVVRAAAAESLGHLGIDDEARLALQAQLQSSAQPVVIGALRGLALMKSPLSVDAVLPLTMSDDVQVRLHAYWVLRNSGEPKLRDMLHERLKANPDAQTQCALLDTLKMVATADDVTWARRMFDRTDPEADCEPVVWDERNERRHYVLYSDTLRVKYLKVVANGSGGEQRAWFERIVADPEQPWRVREVAAEIVKRLDESGQRR